MKKRTLNIPVYLFLIFSFTSGYALQKKIQEEDGISVKNEIVPGAVWKDTDGNVINAHGGGILYHDGTYYWYGESKGDSTYRLDWVTSWECWRADAGGVSCYSSKDLIHWKFEGLALPATPEYPESDLHPSQVIERPKVIYNDKTGKFVMWMHIESPDYEKAHAGVAISDSPSGHFKYLGSFKPNGQDSRDQTLFKDDDGRAYHICSSEWNKTLYISLLTEDYTKPSGIYTRNFVNQSREAPAVFKHRGKYYMITSGCTGWDPNIMECAVADSMLGEWTVIGNPCKGVDADSTFHAQSTFVFPVKEKNNQYIAMFDRWNKTNLIDSRYVWLPLVFVDGKPVIEWVEKFSVSCSEKVGNSTNYYFDAVEGNKDNSGISPDKPFQSLSKLRELKLQPGDSVLLQSGVVFTEELYIECKGALGNPVVFGKFGGAERPHIKGDASKMQAIHVFNSEYIVLRDLEISNKGEEPVAGLNGVLVELKNYGTANDILLDNLLVHDVFGTLVKENNGGGNAILFRNYREDKSDTLSSRFDGLVVQNCQIKNCQRNGIMMWGNWIRKEWNPSMNVIFRNNILEGVPGDGIVPVACESPLVEYNIMQDCPATLPPSEACDGIWPWSCDNAVVQYNIVSGHKSQVDGYGFDSDWNSTNSLFQFNLSFNNDGGFLLVCNSGGWPKDWSLGNQGTIVRYNISINDGLRGYAVKSKGNYFSPVIHITGPTEKTMIEKNLIYILKKPKSEIDKTILDMTDWSGYPDSTFFRKNYIYVEEPNTAIKTNKSTNNLFENNYFVGELKTQEEGFIEFSGNFDKSMWYDEADENWEKLLDFIKGKSIKLNGKTIRVSKIIGYN